MADDKKEEKVDAWTASGPVIDPKYDPREDPGPARIEDSIPPSSPYDPNYKPVKSSSKEVPLEDSRKDETTVLATDPSPAPESPPAQ